MKLSFTLQYLIEILSLEERKKIASLISAQGRISSVGLFAIKLLQAPDLSLNEIESILRDQETNNSSVSKRRTLNLILDGWVTISGSVIGKSISMIRLLIERGLESEALHRIPPLKQKANDSESFYELFELLKLESEAITAPGNLNRKKNWAEILEKELDECKDKLDEHLRFEHIYLKYYNRLKNSIEEDGQVDQELLEELGKHPLIFHSPPPCTVKAQMCRLRLQFSWHNYSSNMKGTQQVVSQLIKLFKGNPSILTSDTLLYVELLNKRILSHFASEDFAEGKKLLKELEGIKTNTVKESIDLFLKLNMAHVHLALSTKEYMPCLERVSQIETNLVKYDHRLDTFRKYLIQFFVGRLLFETKYFAAASKWFGKIIDCPVKDVREDFQILSRLMNIMALAELREDEITITSMAESLLKYIGRRKDLFPLEQKIARFFRSYSHYQSRAQRQKKLNRLNEKLAHLMENDSGPSSLNYFDFVTYFNQSQDFLERT